MAALLDLVEQQLELLEMSRYGEGLELFSQITAIKDGEIAAIGEGESAIKEFLSHADAQGE
jgi:N-acyl-D-aspartate/D-glutamate deacylase